MSKPAGRTIIIAGGGIAGLTAALGLARAGFQVIVLERSRTPREEGAGIQVPPNAWHVLADLGLAPLLRVAATFPDHIALRDGASGKVLGRFELGDRIRERHGAPYAVLHRGDLLQSLLGACTNSSAIDLRFGDDAMDAVAHPRGVTVLIRRGTVSTELRAAALVVADGVWSNLRTSVPDAAVPVFTGRVAWRKTVAAEPSDQTPNTDLWLAPKAHVVTYPMRQGAELNIVVVTDWPGEAPPPAGTTIRNMRPTFPAGRWASDLRETLQTDDDQWTGWPIHAIPEPGAVAAGPIALIGDAAHAMEPYAAQGGAQAIEDATVLTQKFAMNADDLSVAAADYAAARASRIARVLKLTGRNRVIYHMSKPLSLARDLAMQIAPQEALQKRMDPIYGWRLEPTK